MFDSFSQRSDEELLNCFVGMDGASRQDYDAMAPGTEGVWNAAVATVRKASAA